MLFKHISNINNQELIDKLGQQEKYDQEKFRQAQEKENERNRMQSSMRTGYTPEPGFFKSTLTLAERKRMEWQKERGN